MNSLLYVLEFPLPRLNKAELLYCWEGSHRISHIKLQHFQSFRPEKLTSCANWTTNFNAPGNWRRLTDLWLTKGDLANVKGMFPLCIAPHCHGFAYLSWGFGALVIYA